MDEDDIFSPLSDIFSGTTDSSSGGSPLEMRLSFTFRPFSTVSSETTKTSTPSMTESGP